MRGGGSEARPSDEILARAANRFNVRLSADDVTFVRVHRKWLVEASSYPMFTMIGQMVGSMLVALEALWRDPPDVFLDTTGYAFTYPLARYLAGCRVASYTHYPTISSDMLQRVVEQRPTYNNDERIAKSKATTLAKWIYYKIFARFYSAAGRCADVVMVNSTWTYGHINSMWGQPAKTSVVYPPCDTARLQKIGVGVNAGGVPRPRQRIVLSIGQFRPEKDHKLQLLTMSALKSLDGGEHADVRLILIGGCRDEGDRKRVDELKQMCKDLGIDSIVEFHINAPYPVLVQYLRAASVGIHTMWNEHFGIGVVEMMASGVIPVAHDSGGPKSDIVKCETGHRTGFLESTPQGYAKAIAKIFAMDNIDRVAIRQLGIDSVNRFSEENFAEAFTRAMDPILNTTMKPKKQ